MFRVTHISPAGKVANVRELPDEAEPEMAHRLHTPGVRCVVTMLSGGGTIVYEADAPDLELDPAELWGEHILSSYQPADVPRATRTHRPTSDGLPREDER